jgi:hypothetical protein
MGHTALPGFKRVRKVIMPPKVHWLDFCFPEAVTEITIVYFVWVKYCSGYLNSRVVSINITYIALLILCNMSWFIRLGNYPVIYARWGPIWTYDRNSITGSHQRVLVIMKCISQLCIVSWYFDPSHAAYQPITPTLYKSHFELIRRAGL